LLRQLGDRNDHQINQKGIRITKIVGADLPLETKRNVAGVAGLAFSDAVETDFGFDIEI
jgi:homoserine kinase